MSTNHPSPRIVSLEEVQETLKTLTSEELLCSQAKAFIAYSDGSVSVPAVQTMGQQPLAAFAGHPDAQACVKSAYENGGNVFVTKIASGGGGSNSGLSIVFSQHTFRPEAILLDDGLLTEVRTAATGALVAKHFAPSNLSLIGLVGVGVQARYQLRALAHVTQCRHVRAWARSPEKVQTFASELNREGWQVEVATEAELACKDADLIVTTTPSRSPIVQKQWTQGRSVLITAVGADAPGKQELDPELVSSANLVLVDSLQQCQERGELQHSWKMGLVDPSKVVEIGKALADKTTSPRGLTVFDATGVAIQDVKIAEAVLERLSNPSRPQHRL